VAVLATPDTVTGRVASVNPKGVKLEGHPDWFNFSRYASDIVPPMRGQAVALTLDRQGFVRNITAGVTAKTDETMSVASLCAGIADRNDRTITRLAVLNAAAEFAANRPQVKSGEVLKIAASWEWWVNRDADDDLTDAF